MVRLNHCHKCLMFALMLLLGVTRLHVCFTGIYDLGCVGECMNLERLDLSGNNITNLAPLSSLRLLLVLNVSANRISNLGKDLYPCLDSSYHLLIRIIFGFHLESQNDGLHLHPEVFQ